MRISGVAAIHTALLLYVASIPLFGLRTDLFVITWIFGLQVALFYGLDIIQNHGRFRLKIPYIFLLVWLLVGSLALVFKGGDLPDGVVRARSVVLNLGMMIVISDIVSRGGDQLIRRIVTVYGIASLISLAAGLFSSAPSDIFSGRFDAGMYNPNQTTFMFATAAVGFLFLLLTSKGTMTRIMLLVSIMLTSLGVLLTGSRQGLLVLAVGSLVLIVFQRRRMAALATVGLLVLSALIVVEIIDVDQSLLIERRIEQFGEFFSGNQNADTSALTRLELIGAGWRMFQEHPLIGVGFNQYKHYVIDYGGPRSTYAHNNYIEVLTTSGIVGFALYYGVLFVTCWRAYRSRRLADANLLTLSLVCMLLIGDLFRVSYYQRIETTLLAVAIGVQFSRTPIYGSLLPRISRRFRHHSLPLGNDTQAAQSGIGETAVSQAGPLGTLDQ